MDSTPENTKSSFFGRSIRRLFSTRILSRCLFILACLATLIAIFYTVENWRGKRAWEQCRRDLEARGANLDWAAYVPAPVPDEQNAFKAPNITEWFVKNSRASNWSNGLSAKLSSVSGCLDLRSSEVVAEVMVESLNATVAPEEVDVTLQLTNAVVSSPSQLQALRRALNPVLTKLSNPSAGPMLKGAQNMNLVLAANHSVPPAKILIRSDRTLEATGVAGLLPANLFGAVFPSGKVGRVEPAGTNRFQVFLNQHSTCTAADYVACTDQLAPEFDAIRKALERPCVRREGNYEQAWEAPIPNFVIVRSLAQTLAQRAQCYLLLGEPEAALRELTMLNDMRRLLQGKPVTLVAEMIDVAVSGLYVSIIADGLRLHAWREPQLVALERQLKGIRLLGPFVESIRTERIGTCHLLETVKPKDLDKLFAFGPAQPTFWEKITNPEFWLLRFLPRGWVYQNMAAVASCEESLIETVDMTIGLVRPLKVEQLQVYMRGKLDQFAPYTFLARLAVPNYLKATQTLARNQAMVNQAMVACALERFRLTHHAYPEKLADLVPGCLEKLPPDVASTNGQPMQYRLKTDGQFLLYSTGWNQKDDGGNPGKKNDEGDWVWDSSRF